ncbi:hypothetical protein ACFSNO_22820 [Streptomyces cirratus]
MENVLWVKNGTLFVTINVPGGSNNDADPWYGAPTASQEQLDEAARRTAADLRWLDTAFALAHTGGISSVVCQHPGRHVGRGRQDRRTRDELRADRPPAWPRTPRRSVSLVLLLVGDSHVYRSDDPLRKDAPCRGRRGCLLLRRLEHPPGL